MPRSLIALLAVVALALGGCTPRMAVYRLERPTVTATTLPALAGGIVPAGATVSETADRFVFRTGPTRLEVYKASGGFWLEDSVRLWNAALTPQLGDSSALRHEALALSLPVHHRGLQLSRDTAFTSFEYAGIRPTFVTTRSRSGRTQTVNLDWQATVAAWVADPKRPGDKYPVVGGGGSYRIHYGDAGRVIGFHGVWRAIQGVARRERVVPGEEADRQFRERFRGHAIVFQRRLAYYSAPAPDAQNELSPVYVYSGKEFVNGDSIPLRVTMLPATRPEGGPGSRCGGTPRGEGEHPTANVAPSQAPRTKADLPPEGSTDPEASKNPLTRREVGTSWIGAIDGLASSQADATGLTDALKADGWKKNFDWGDANAWYGDWKDNREQWADAADLVFYVGHASLGGWKLYDPVNGTAAEPRYLMLKDTDAAAEGGYGGEDLEWIVISACGPLEDESVGKGGGNALDRWAGAFRGLHLLLGYASDSYDNAEDGPRFAKYALEGRTLVNAWFRASAEAMSGFSGGNMWAGAMWARDTRMTGARSPYLDHLWGHGDVAPDPREPNEWSIIWNPI